MVRYDSGLGKSYETFSYDRNFHEDSKESFSLAVSKQTRELTGSLQALVEDGFSMIGQPIIIDVEGVECAIERWGWQLDQQLGGISNQLMELGMALDNGITQVLTELGSINQSLEDILEALNTKVEKDAYNHFNIARDNFRRKFHPEALERLEKAIAGEPGISSGYKEGWKFHHLKGLVLLDDSPLQDAVAAEKEFIAADRYAYTPNDKGTALLCASKAAEMVGRFGPAFEYAEKGRKLVSQEKLISAGLDTELQYQTARMHIALGRVNPGFAVFRELVRKDLVPYIMRAANDGIFQRHNDKLDLMLGNYRLEKLGEVQRSVDDFFKSGKFEELSTSYKDLPTVAELRQIYLDSAGWGIADFIKFRPNLEQALVGAKCEMDNEEERRADEKRQRLEEKKRKAEEEHKREEALLLEEAQSVKNSLLGRIKWKPKEIPTWAGHPLGRGFWVDHVLDDHFWSNQSLMDYLNPAKLRELEAIANFYDGWMSELEKMEKEMPYCDYFARKFDESIRLLKEQYQRLSELGLKELAPELYRKAGEELLALNRGVRDLSSYNKATSRFSRGGWGVGITHKASFHDSVENSIKLSQDKELAIGYELLKSSYPSVKAEPTVIGIEEVVGLTQHMVELCQRVVSAQVKLAESKIKECESSLSQLNGVKDRFSVEAVRSPEGVTHYHPTPIFHRRKKVEVQLFGKDGLQTKYGDLIEPVEFTLIGEKTLADYFSLRPGLSRASFEIQSNFVTYHQWLAVMHDFVGSGEMSKDGVILVRMSEAENYCWRLSKIVKEQTLEKVAFHLPEAYHIKRLGNGKPAEQWTKQGDSRYGSHSGINPFRVVRQLIF